MPGLCGRDIPTIGINLDWPTEGPISEFTESDKRFVALMLHHTLWVTLATVLDEKTIERREHGLEREDEGMGTG